MKIKLEVGIYGVPPKLNLRAKILHGDKEQFETKVFKRSYSLDAGGSVSFDVDFFEKFVSSLGLKD